MIRGTSLFAAAAVALFASACLTAVDSEPDDPIDDVAQAVSPNACHWRCQQCSPNKLCITMCERIGNCEGQCDVIAQCITGYVWDDVSCSCVPGCSYDGRTYSVGDSFPAVDGCNSCSCSEGGLVACTMRLCHKA